MSLILCQQCYSWVEPIAEQCPQCDYPLDPRLPDPTQAELAQAIGRLVGPIGDVRIGRSMLPGSGLLYETTNGLLFVPHRLEQVKLAPGPAVKRRWAAVLTASLRAPRRLLGRAWERKAGASMEIAAGPSRRLAPADRGRLPALLMENPGVFFVPKRSIREITRSLRGWTVARPNGLVLRFKPARDHREFHHRMAALAEAVREAVCP
jgi:hypothetical protein